MPALTFRKKTNDKPVELKEPKKSGERRRSAVSFFTSLKNSFLPAIPRTSSQPLELNKKLSVATTDESFPEVNFPLGDLNTDPSASKPEFATIAPGLLSPVSARRFPRNTSTVHDLIPGKLCIAFHPTHEHSCAAIRRRPDLFYFSTNLHERYTPFFKDFGPVSLGIIYHFWQYVKTKEYHPLLRGRPLVYYTDVLPKDQANAAVLLGAYMMLEHNMSADETAKAFEKLPQYPFLPFTDITTTTKFVITVRDCLEALENAIKVGWFDKSSFDAQLFMDLEDPVNGDISLVGDKFIAFRGPNTTVGAEWTVPPSKYAPAFEQLGVSCVVRLNERSCYDKKDFESQGLIVHDLEFEDCSCPTPELVERFLDICDSAEGRVAVHCKAGLGRTGTMIGLWMMKHLGFTARQTIAWLRLSRPGSVIGRQQDYLAMCENAVWKENWMENRIRGTRPSSHDSGRRMWGFSEPRAPTAALCGKEALGRQVDAASRRRAQLRMRASLPA